MALRPFPRIAVVDENKQLSPNTALQGLALGFCLFVLSGNSESSAPVVSSNRRAATETFSFTVPFVDPLTFPFFVWAESDVWLGAPLLPVLLTAVLPSRVKASNELAQSGSGRQHLSSTGFPNGLCFGAFTVVQTLVSWPCTMLATRSGSLVTSAREKGNRGLRDLPPLHAKGTGNVLWVVPCGSAPTTR